MPRGFIITVSRLYHDPLLLRIKLGILRPGEVEVNLRRMLLDTFRRPSSNDSHDTRRPEAIMSRGQSNDRPAEQSFGVIPYNIFPSAPRRKLDPKGHTFLRKSGTNDMHLEVVSKKI